MHRFFISHRQIAEGKVVFAEDAARQMRNVLRLKPGSRVIVLDGQGEEYEVELLQVAGNGVVGEIRASRPASGEPLTQVALYLCLTQREKFEWILQKCTELGVCSFVPVVSSRTLVPKEQAQSKVERWQKIIREAAEQSGRGRLPHLGAALSFAEAVQEAGAARGAAFLLWEGEKECSLRRAYAGCLRQRAGVKPAKISLFVGPEGGFSEEEVGLARDQGWQPVSLGVRILRMETAAVVAPALILYESGELGN